MRRRPALYLGLVSGTSMDGIDAAVVGFAGGRVRVVEARTTPWPPDLAARLRAAAAGRIDLDELGRLDRLVGRHLAEAAAPLLARHPVRAIGSHGQTLRHRPDADPPFTLQIGDPATLAERTGVTTVADFRRRDVAAGGEGAPLTPAFHRYAFRRHAPVAVLNLGGIANVTLIDGDGEVRAAFDTGPGNGLLDHWARTRLGAPCDRDGAAAARGRVQPALLEALLAHPYFGRPPPKSTGPEVLGPEWLEGLLRGRPEPAPEDGAATLAELTAWSAAVAVRAHLPEARRILVCGGGAHNRHLLARLAAHAAPVPVATTAAAGLDPDWVEAAAFAWLARETLASRSGSLPVATGAARAAVLGGIWPGRGGLRR
ncbi:anhydro-N-acetylmuramic acid kinase [Inmirania thermothiophila]|uniref:Anhydro-N-acetylmuramic acid kinase n=1 Tax=Inmirania thermothiophila TaxID=1750597 RepID=A0A3N1XSU3_9GAMM|nr:anhydro-N-acetylmuramic acid kinase [Inmirania thermothiophila]ROR29716.1 anhydro-N-acetylmuramic acid kinase [Inmirania thermothiophila]